MMLDSSDLMILRLAGLYGWLPAESFRRFSHLNQLTCAVKTLSSFGLMSFARNGSYYNLSPRGYELLRKHGYSYETPAKRAYLKSATLTRRLETAAIALTCLQAGMNVLCEEIEDLQTPPAFLPALALRRQGGNLMNAASCIGFAHFAGGGYMFQYVSGDNAGMYLSNELKHLHNLTVTFCRENLSDPIGLVFAGESYKSIYSACLKKVVSPKHGKRAYKDLWHVYERLLLPIYFLTCDDTGVMQLALMGRQGYKSRIAETAFGGRWYHANDQIPEADGHVDGTPLVIAIDMDVRRVLQICRSAESLGLNELMVAALENQMNGLLLDILSPYKFVTPLLIREPVLLAAFGEKIIPSEFTRKAAEDIKGGHIFV